MTARMQAHFNSDSDSPPGSGLFLSPEQINRMRGEVVERALTEHLAAASRDPAWPLDVQLNDAATHELERLRSEAPTLETRRQKAFWSRVAREFPHADKSARVELLREIIADYVREITGYFDPRVYKLAARILPLGFRALFTRLSPVGFLTSMGSRFNLEKNLVVTGAVDEVRDLSRRGTLIMTPMHLSNLDSMVIGLALHLSNLPPFTYGAGLNLFTNPILAFFMNHLGAYKVDRRKQSRIYKSTLKTYATMTLEMGQHNLFFPGGARNRRGDVEQKIKLGLLGCGLSAYSANLAAGKERPDIFIVPCTLSYELVLEAKTLIEQHLQQAGRSRFIRFKSDATRLTRQLNFWRNLRNMHSDIHLHICEPLDLFGNRVDREGNSRDAQGRPVDRRKYLEIQGGYGADSQRDRQYTRELGERILESFRRNNILLCTHIAAFALFETIKAAHPKEDLFHLVRLDGEPSKVPLDDVRARMERLVPRLVEMDGKGDLRLAAELRGKSPWEIFQSALSHFQSFHNGDVLRVEDNEAYSLNMKLLYYYRNKLDHYGLEKGAP